LSAYPEWNNAVSIAGVCSAFFLENTQSFEEFKKVNEEKQKILRYRENVNSKVAVTEGRVRDKVERSLIINDKAEANAVSDLQTQVLLGQVPLMLYPDLGDGLVIGLGSCIKGGSAPCHQLRSLDVVEIASEVVECNDYFASQNYNVLQGSRVKTYIDDAVIYLKVARKEYDCIISEPSNRWIAGVGNLFSRQSFELCKARLRRRDVLTSGFTRMILRGM
jgi:spermidine synthase